MANLSSKQRDTLARRLWAIGDTARLRMLNLLPEEPSGENCHNVCSLAEKLGLSQPTVSHHLRILRQAGLIHGKKCCRDVYYWVDKKAAESLLTVLREVLLTQEQKTTSRKSTQNTGD
jgi:ArsR family transcriptional regulator